MTGFVEPEPGHDTVPWWEALAEGQLTVPTCDDCRRRFFPPQPYCPHCGSTSAQLQPHAGDGTVYSWVVVHRAFAEEFAGDVPYGIVAVDLDGGGRLVGRFSGDPGLLRDGLPVTAEIEGVADFGILWFRPHDEEGTR
ncbi:hypothetical protein GCM10009836_25530 [Pseudonocardia ailaonensis]|uniref:DNA-binding protein n=1 Tax=Pseudonocardia ailaonensis TaxID=367279 RepID=A0ABN2MZG9_9PSEU